MNDFNETREKILKLYNEDKDVKVIAKELDLPGYIVESVLISEYRIYFR